MLRFFKLGSAVSLLALLFSIATAARPAAAAPAHQAGPQTWTVTVGYQINTNGGEYPT